MYVRNVALDDYRSYASGVVELEPGVCVLLGRNGQGKTNFVEALAYLSTLHSHRVSADTALVRHAPGDKQLPAAVIRVKAIEGERERRIDLEIVSGKANRARIGRTQVPPAQVVGEFPTVLFSPEDLDIVRGGPDGRRRLMDDMATMRTPVLAGFLFEHSRILRQRGALLKKAAAQVKRGGSPDLSTLEVWDEHLAPVAARIIVERSRLITDLAPHVSRAYADLSDGSELEVTYRPQVARFGATFDITSEAEVRDVLLGAYRVSRESEVRRGVNLAGAHLDDLELVLNGLPVRGFASHGETWSTALALRLGEFELFRRLGPVPVLILDDVFAELDAARRTALLAIMSEADQVLITAAVDADIPSELKATIYRVERVDGCTRIRREGADG